MATTYICSRCGDKRLPPPHDWAGEGDRFRGATEPHPGGLGPCGDLHEWEPKQYQHNITLAEVLPHLGWKVRVVASNLEETREFVGELEYVLAMPGGCYELRLMTDADADDYTSVSCSGVRSIERLGA